MGARFSAPVETGPGAHPASCTMGTGSFLGVKSGWGVMLTSHPLLVPWLWKGRAIPLPPYGLYGLYRASVPVQGCTLPLPLPLHASIKMNFLDFSFMQWCQFRLWSSGLCQYVASYISTNIMVELPASIFRVDIDSRSLITVHSVITQKKGHNIQINICLLMIYLIKLCKCICYNTE